MKTENKLLIVSVVGIVVSAVIAFVYNKEQEPAAGIFSTFLFFFSLVVGNIAAEDKPDSVEFNTWILWNTYYKSYPLNSNIGLTPIKYHYPKLPGQQDVRKHDYRYTCEEMYEIFLKEKEKEK